MTAFLIVLAVAAEAYLLGSVDTGILVSKFVYHDDVRSHGSGAAGMTNMLRTFGKKAAALTAAGDVLKGVAAVCIGRWLFGFLPADAAVSPYLGVYLTAILAVVGHTKPIYFGFKGGKGVLHIAFYSDAQLQQFAGLLGQYDPEQAAEAADPSGEDEA